MPTPPPAESRPPVDLDLPKDGFEILTPKTYGLSGRILVASLVPENLSQEVLNPSAIVEDSTIAAINRTADTRNYTQVTLPLSNQERADAWEGQNLSTALTDWMSKFTQYATTTTNEGRKNAIKTAAGGIESLTVADTEELIYNRYCKGNSDVSIYVRTSLSAFTQPDGKIDIARLKTQIGDITWLASKLFGTETSRLVEEMVKVEAEMINNKDNTLKVLVDDPTTRKLNDISPDDTSLLTKVQDILRKTPTPPAPVALAATTPPIPPGWSVFTPFAPTPAALTPAPTSIPAAEGDSDEDEQIILARESEAGKKVEQLLEDNDKAVDEEATATTEEAKRNANQKQLETISALIELTGDEDAVLACIKLVTRFADTITANRLDHALETNPEEVFAQHPDIKALNDALVASENKLYLLASEKADQESSPWWRPGPIAPAPITGADGNDPWSSVPGWTPQPAPEHATEPSEPEVAPLTPEAIAPSVTPEAAPTAPPQAESPSAARDAAEEARLRQELLDMGQQTTDTEAKKIQIAALLPEERKDVINKSLTERSNDPSVQFMLAKGYLQHKIIELLVEHRNPGSETGDLSVTPDGSYHINGLKVKGGLLGFRKNDIDIEIHNDPDNPGKLAFTPTGNEAVDRALASLTEEVTKEFTTLLREESKWKVAGVTIGKNGPEVRYIPLSSVVAEEAPSNEPTPALERAIPDPLAIPQEPEI